MITPSIVVLLVLAPITLRCNYYIVHYEYHYNRQFMLFPQSKIQFVHPHSRTIYRSCSFMYKMLPWTFDEGLEERFVPYLIFQVFKP